MKWGRHAVQVAWAPNRRVFNGSSAVGGQNVNGDQQEMGSGSQAMCRGAHMGGGHPRWETEWVVWVWAQCTEKQKFSNACLFDRAYCEKIDLELIGEEWW